MTLSEQVYGINRNQVAEWVGNFRGYLNNNSMEKRFLNIKECSEYLGISIGTLYDWSSENRIPCCKVGRALRFDIKEKINGWTNLNKMLWIIVK